MRILRNLLIAIVALVLLLVVALGVAMTVIDPNDYKSNIEQLAADNTNLELELAGDINWSLMPLGLEINEVNARLEGDEFVGLEQLIASVDLWSLIMMSPSVHTFTLEGLNAVLVKEKDGKGNWERIVPSAETAPEPTETPSEPEAPAETEQPQTAGTGGAPINFNVERIRIGNARVRYEDRTTGQSMVLEETTLQASDIALGQPFPLELSFAVALNKPVLQVDGRIGMTVSASEDLKVFSVTDLDSRFDLTGEATGGNTATARLGGAINADLTDETLDLKDLTASFENLQATTNLSLQGFNVTPALKGDLRIAEFSLRQLLKSLGKPTPETADADVLKRIAFQTAIDTKDKELQLRDLELQLDDTRLSGQLGYGLSGGAISADLQGTTLNVDRYLPPKKEEPATEPDPPEADAAATPPAENDKPLLPLETLRALTLDVRLGLAKLIAKKLTISDIDVRVTGDKGLLALQNAGGSLYEGDFNLTAKLDARTDNPEWQFVEKLNGVRSQPLLMDLLELDLISGKVNVNASGSSLGNSIKALLENSKGKASFNIDEGALENTNLTHLACQGIAMAHNESLQKEDWGDKTPFDDMSGNFTIDAGTLRNKNLTADVAGIRLEGDGLVNLIESRLDYRMGLRIVGEVHRDKACRVNERLQNVVIPVRCRGAFTDAPGSLCGFDKDRFTDVLESMVKAEAKRKVDEKVEEKKDELKTKAKEKLAEEIPPEKQEKIKQEIDEAKEKLKGLFR